MFIVEANSRLNQRLDGHIAVVTGGESGIGRTVAELFGSQGCDIALTYFRDSVAGEATAETIRASGSRAIALQTDIRDESQVEALFDRCKAELGEPTLLVNDAGINEGGISVVDMSLDRWRTVIETNLTGPFLACRRFARDLRARGCRGKIINVSSIHQEIAVPGGSEYCASKAGLAMLTKCLALELAGQGINVNNLAPGMVLTPMNERAVDDIGYRRSLTRHIPLQRAATAEEIARVALFLALPESDYATGSTITLDGGLALNLGQGA